MEENFDWEQFPKPTEELLPEKLPEEIQAEQEALARKEKKEEMKKNLRFSSNRIGWATVLLISVWIGLMFVITVVAETVDYTVGSMLPFSAVALYNQYAWLLNEISLGIAISIAVLILFPIPKAENGEKRAVELSRFVKIMLICFGVGYFSNLIGTFVLSIWNGFTGNSAGDELETVLYGMNPLMLFLFSVVMAPLLEELFFRKLLIDRLRPFGRTVSIFLPAFLFALFHQSAEQLLYAFAVGAILAYFYYETGKYWLTVAIHAAFNWISGFIPLQFLPKLTDFFYELERITEGMSQTATAEEMAEQLMPLIEIYGGTLALYGFYLLIMFAVNITGVVLFFANIKKFRQNKEESVLTGKEAVKAVMLNPGMIVCTAVLGVLTVISLFA